MARKQHSYEFNLNAAGVDEASEWLFTVLTETSIEKSEQIRMRLLFEEALLNYIDYFGEGLKASAHLETRWSQYRLRIIVEGAKHNPLMRETDGELDEWSTAVFSSSSIHIHYAYAVNANVLRMSIKKPSMNPVLKIGIAIAVGSAIGLLGNLLIPDQFQIKFSTIVLNPVSDMWVRLLQAISGPIIFLTALTATFGTKRIADFGGSRITTLVRYFAISSVVTVFALIVSRPFYPIDIGAIGSARLLFESLLENAVQLIPGNLVEPFSTANTPQLLIIAIITGYLLATIEHSVDDLKTLINQLNVLGMTLARATCSLVPFFVGLILCLKIWTHDTDTLIGIWAPLILATAISALAFAGTLVVSSITLHISPVLLARKLKGSFVAALKRGTLDFSSIDDIAASCKQLLGINFEFARAVLPQGLFLYMPTSAVGICVFVIFAAQNQQIHVDQAWLLSVFVLSVILSVATPPVTGANLLSFVMAFSYLGISSDAFLDVMVFDIVFGVICIAFDQAMLQIETISQAQRMGFLDEETLRAPLDAAA